jgi:very-short-patch-repair endonuclease
MNKGCRTCGHERVGKLKSSNVDEFIDKATKAHGDLYDYSNVEYVKSNENVIIICNTHGQFNQQPNNHLNGANCPMCSNKTETKLFDALKPMYPTLITQFKQEWCKKSRCLPFDFCIPDHNIIIELDGAQHFRQVSNWTSPEDTFKNDLFKEKCANDNGYSVIRILQEDVFGDKYDWLSNLQTDIENIIKDDTIIHNIYMCENGEYDNFILE